MKSKWLPWLLFQVENTDGRFSVQSSFSRMSFPDTPQRHAKWLPVTLSPSNMPLNVHDVPSSWNSSICKPCIVWLCFSGHGWQDQEWAPDPKELIYPVTEETNLTLELCLCKCWVRAVLEGSLDKRENMMWLLMGEAMEAEKKAQLVKMKKNDSKESRGLASGNGEPWECWFLCLQSVMGRYGCHHFPE